MYLPRNTIIILPVVGVIADLVWILFEPGSTGRLVPAVILVLICPEGLMFSSYVCSQVRKTLLQCRHLT